MSAKKIEYCVMMPRVSTVEPHRGPMSLEAAEDFVSSSLEEGFKEGTFVVYKREITEWSKK